MRISDWSSDVCSSDLSLDLLLIDDIQFFGGKNRTQEEFFYAFEALIAAKKQIIITSDTYPKEITGMDDRLISRFDSGLTVAVEPPELEMRVAILLKKDTQEGESRSEKRREGKKMGRKRKS